MNIKEEIFYESPSVPNPLKILKKDLFLHITKFFLTAESEENFSFFSAFILDVQIYTAKLLSRIWRENGKGKEKKAHNNKFTKSFVDQT